MRNDGTHLPSVAESAGNRLHRIMSKAIGYLYTQWNKRRFGAVGKGFSAPHPIHVVNGKNISLGDNVFLGLHAQLYASPEGRISIGHNTSLDRFVEVRGGRLLQIGNHVRIVKGATLKCPDTSDLVIGDRTVISQGCILDGGIQMGNDVTLGPNVFINDEDHGFADVTIPINQQAGIIGRTVIQDDVWIANGVSILKNVVVSKGAVIGAGAVVNKNVPPYSINVGVPSRTIKYRDGSNGSS